MAKMRHDWPFWAQRALQGITYWIGHRRCLYRHYPLAEGALVAEICNLIYANLPDDLMLMCEVQYKSFLPKVKEVRNSAITQRARADLVIAKKSGTKGGDPTPKYVIEVKRAGAPKSQIDSDLRRLSALREAHKEIRTFMFVIAEANRPNRFVNEAGKSRLGRHMIEETQGYFRVRRTWKAAHAFTRVQKAQYASLLEVYAR
jgi:hypothetical protein